MDDSDVMIARASLFSLLLGFCLWAPAPAIAAEAEAKAVAPEVLAFEQFIQSASPLCLSQPSRVCVDAGWAFADRDGDDRVTLAELHAVRGALIDWTDWRGDSLRPGERTAITLGVWMADSAGLENLMASFNVSGDGRLTKEELLADVRLDQRPLGQVLLDPGAVDREAVARRIGPYSPVLEGLLRPAE